MKKVLSIVLVLILTFMSLGTTSIHAIAAATPEISFDNVETETGETVSLELSINNNPGIAGLAISLKYDTDSLTLTDTKKGTLFSGFTAGKNFAWDESEDVTADGILATFTFAVSETADPGDYEIEVIVRSCTNENLDDVVFEEQNIHNGKITVKEKPVAATGVSLNKESLSLKTGESETLIATVSPDNATNKAATWESSDDTVATVDDNGKVTAVKKGVVTITATTEDGNFSATCEVSVACSHANTTVHLANDSTCLVQGNNEYTTCDDCGIVVSGSDAKLPLAEHTGGAATCKDKAVCSVCNQPYGDYTGHKLSNYPRNEADHDNVGNIEYWTCDVCNKYFSDGNGANEITQADTVIEKIPHSHSTEWSSNDAQHWHECGCGNKIDVANHSFDNNCDTTCDICGYTRTTTHDWNTTWSNDSDGHWMECKECGLKKDEGSHNGGTATCKDKAVCSICNVAYGSLAEHSYKEVVDAKYLKSVANCVSPAEYYKSCEVCEIASATETFTNGDVDETNHVGETEIKNAVEATCTTDGYTGDTYCKDCGEKISDGQVIPAAHKTIKVDAVDATHEKDGNIEYYTCAGCDKLFLDEDATTEITLADTVIAKGEHSYGDTYESDADNHWKECECGNIIEKDTHTFGEWSVTKDATETEKGSKEKICSVCGYKVTEEIPVINDDATNENIPEKAPQTGDANNIFLWITLFVLSGTALIVTTSYRRKCIK